MRSFNKITGDFILLVLIFFFVSVSCNTKSHRQGFAKAQKIGVLLVNHGSRSDTWRQALLQLEKNVTDPILKSGEVKGIKTAFMEYTEPSIATRLKEFDKEGYTDIIVVPVFLTVSPHSFDDIPTIVGQKEDPQSVQMLKLEKIERYAPSADVHITPLLDFTDIVRKNVLRRTVALSQNPANEALVLIGYGDETYNKEWSELFNNAGEFVKEKTGINVYTYGWCGHLVHYNSDSTSAPVNRALKQKNKAIVIPVLVAHDENFQVKIIGGSIEKVPNYNTKVLYKPDAILPDTSVDNWVIHVTKDYLHKIKSNSK